MSTLNLTFTDSGFPDPFAGDAQDLVDSFVANLTATIPTTSLILGGSGGILPLTDIGPVFIFNNALYVWDGAAYSPAILKLANSGFLITLGSGTLTGNRAISFQDSDGIVALTSDVFNTRGTTVVAGGTTPDFDWSVSSTFYKSFGANNVATFSNSLPGQEIVIATNATGAFTMTWPAIVEWASPGTQPTQTSTATDLWRFTNLAGVIYGERLGAAYS